MKLVGDFYFVGSIKRDVRKLKNLFTACLLTTGPVREIFGSRRQSHCADGHADGTPFAVIRSACSSPAGNIAYHTPSPLSIDNHVNNFITLRLFSHQSTRLNYAPLYFHILWKRFCKRRDCRHVYAMFDTVRQTGANEIVQTHALRIGVSFQAFPLAFLYMDFHIIISFGIIPSICGYSCRTVFRHKITTFQNNYIIVLLHCQVQLFHMEQ